MEGVQAGKCGVEVSNAHAQRWWLREGKKKKPVKAES